MIEARTANPIGPHQRGKPGSSGPLDEKMLRPIVVSPVSEKDPIATWWTGDV